jgi:plasmid stabilization system protein ParE
MKKYQVEITVAAEAKLREAYLWIQEDSPERATRWQKGLFKQIERLETLPERCPLAPENQFFAEEI